MSESSATFATSIYIQPLWMSSHSPEQREVKCLAQYLPRLPPTDVHPFIVSIELVFSSPCCRLQNKNCLFNEAIYLHCCAPMMCPSSYWARRQAPSIFTAQSCTSYLHRTSTVMVHFSRGAHRVCGAESMQPKVKNNYRDFMSREPKNNAEVEIRSEPAEVQDSQVTNHSAYPFRNYR